MNVSQGLAEEAEPHVDDEVLRGGGREWLGVAGSGGRG